MKTGIPIPVRLNAYKDRTYDYKLATPPTAWFLKKAANLEKGSGKPLHESSGKVTLKQIYEIAQIKKTDAHLKDIPLESLCKSIVGSAKSLGLDVITGMEGPTGKAKTSAAAPAAAEAPAAVDATPATAAAIQDKKTQKKAAQADKKPKPAAAAEVKPAAEAAKKD